MPADGVPLVKHDDILSFEEILDVVRVAVDLGVTKVRITGGEPLVRRGILDLVSMLAKVDGIRDLAMTTNGTFLTRFARPLKDAGLHRLNISLDTLSPEKYCEMTRGGDLDDALNGIKAALDAGFAGTKLNCVVENSSSEPDAVAVREFAASLGLEARFIRRMDIENGEFWVVEGGSGGDCRRCNRLRLTSDGLLKPCLFSDISFSYRKLGALEAIMRAVEAKPEAGCSGAQNKFYSLGG
ncbi:MAG: radical SAM protein [Candidatus Coatesbacteria bacterium]|nr:radical SAM protein [Candidatus Coatesbacteria bacterium]